MDKNCIREKTVGADLPAFEILHESGSSCLLSLYGAQVLSFIPADGKEVFFLSTQSHLERGKAIRGGIPLVFPQFGKGTLPSHGFARTEMWELVSSSGGGGSPTTITLRLSSNAATLALWPYSFECYFTLSLSDVLTTTMKVVNTHTSTFSFQSAVHSYYKVPHIKDAKIQGLEGGTLIDFLENRSQSTESRTDVTIERATDRVYQNTSNTLHLISANDSRIISIEKSGYRDTVVWNPWQEGNASIADLAEGDFLNFVCIESGNVVEPIQLDPGKEHLSVQTVAVLSL
jgi:glucose-6-phosphate 1-epimerase